MNARFAKRQLGLFFLAMPLLQMSCTTDCGRREPEQDTPSGPARPVALREAEEPAGILGHEFDPRIGNILPFPGRYPPISRDAHHPWYYSFETSFESFYCEKLPEPPAQRGPGIECGGDGHDLKGCR